MKITNKIISAFLQKTELLQASKLSSLSCMMQRDASSIATNSIQKINIAYLNTSYEEAMILDKKLSIYSRKIKMNMNYIEHFNLWDDIRKVCDHSISRMIVNAKDNKWNTYNNMNIDFQKIIASRVLQMLIDELFSLPLLNSINTPFVSFVFRINKTPICSMSDVTVGSIMKECERSKLPDEKSIDAILGMERDIVYRDMDVAKIILYNLPRIEKIMEVMYFSKDDRKLFSGEFVNIIGNKIDDLVGDTLKTPPIEFACNKLMANPNNDGRLLIYNSEYITSNIKSILLMLGYLNVIDSSERLTQRYRNGSLKLVKKQIYDNMLNNVFSEYKEDDNDTSFEDAIKKHIEYDITESEIK